MAGGSWGGAVIGPGDDGMGSSGDGHSWAPGRALSCTLSPSHLGLHLSLQCVWRASLEERGGRPPFCPVPYGCLLGVVVVICSQGPDRCRQGCHAAPTMQLQRGAPRPGLYPGMVLPGSGPEGGQKGEKEAANVGCNVGSGRQSAHPHTGQTGKPRLGPSHLSKASVGHTVAPQTGLPSCW